MHKWKTWILLMLITILTILPVQTMAIDPIDLTQPVSLTINYNWDGARFDLYRVADSDEFAVFTLSGDFVNFKRDINSCENSEDWDAMTQNVTAYVEANQLRPMSTVLVQNKTCKFSGLKAGLYLAIGHDVVVDGTTYVSKPFLICLPDHDGNDVWVYDAVAQPKAGASIPPSVPPTPPHLPQTGQLWWPVPVLLGCGVVCLLIGGIRRRGGDHE